MTNVNITALTDDALEALHVDVLTEQERRNNLAQIPAQVTRLAEAYRAGGGGEDALIEAISAADTPA